MNRRGLVKLAPTLQLPLKKRSIESSTISGKHFLWPLNELCIVVTYTESLLIFTQFFYKPAGLKMEPLSTLTTAHEICQVSLLALSILGVSGCHFLSRFLGTGRADWDITMGCHCGSEGAHSFSPIPSRESL